MVNSFRRPDGFIATEASGQGLQRLQLEMALDARAATGGPLPDILAEAAKAAGGEVLLVLPGPDGGGTNAVVRLTDSGRDSFLQVVVRGTTFAVSEQDEMDHILLRFAHSSVDVLGHLAHDGAIGPIAAAE